MTDKIMEIMKQQPTTIYNPKIVDEDGNTLYDGFTVIHVMEMWYDWFVEIREWDNREPYQHFWGIWSHYNDMHLEDFLRLYAATYGTYDPLSNYDMMEQTLDGKKIDNITETTTPSGTTTNTATTSGQETSETSFYKTGLGSGGTQTLTDVTAATVSSGDQDGDNLRTVTNTLSYEDAETERATTHTNTMSGDFNGDSFTGYHEVMEHRTMKKGNIGVQSAQDLIQKEYDIRRYNILVEYIKQFFQLYGYYTRGVS